MSKTKNIYYILINKNKKRRKRKKGGSSDTLLQIIPITDFDPKKSYASKELGLQSAIHAWLRFLVILCTAVASVIDYNEDTRQKK